MSKAENERRLNAVYLRLKRQEHDQGFLAIKLGAEAGFARLVERHESAKHNLHLDHSGDMGYAVAEDGVVIVSRQQDGPHKGFYGNVESDMASSLTGNKKLASAVVMSKMHKSHERNFEAGVLRSALRVAREKALETFREFKLK